MSVVASKLRDARALIERGWTQKVFARSATRREVNPGSERATCWCAYGALIRVGGEYDAYPYLADVFGSTLISTWNDAKGRTQGEVLAAFDEAIQLAEQGK